MTTCKYQEKLWGNRSSTLSILTITLWIIFFFKYLLGSLVSVSLKYGFPYKALQVKILLFNIFLFSLKELRFELHM